jgi:hypothetical protein
VVAVFAACGVTLIGVVRGVNPDVILVRALVSALLLGIVAWSTAKIVSLFDGR